MKQILIDMMATLMPFMKLPVLWLGVPALIIGTGLLLLKLGLMPFRTPVGHSKWISAVIAGRLAAVTGLTITSWILITLGIFYLVCQALGYFLGMTPTINFGDPTKFEFITYEFWKVGTVFLVPGLILYFFRRSGS